MQTEDLEALNRQFYAAEPWRYFQMRLAHLMLVASDADRYNALFAQGVRLGDIELRFEKDETPRDEAPTAEQTFIAVEAEVLLHHAAETLLRFVHAHDPTEPCPWLRMSRMTGFKEFKDWVKANVTTASAPDLDQLSAATFACDADVPAEVRAVAEYLRLLGRHFLDADSYNAAKHGMALRGGAEQWSVKIEEWELLNRGGATVSWLARWPRNDPNRPTRWTQATRVLSVEACVALIQVTAQLMKALWLKGRERHLDETLTEVIRPTAPADVFAAFNLQHPVIADFFRPIPEPGESQELIVHTRHISPPNEDEESASERD